MLEIPTFSWFHLKSFYWLYNERGIPMWSISCEVSCVSSGCWSNHQMFPLSVLVVLTNWIVIIDCIDSLKETHPPTHSFIHSSTMKASFMCSPTHPFMFSPMHPPHPLIHSFTLPPCMHARTQSYHPPDSLFFSIISIHHLHALIVQYQNTKTSLVLAKQIP